jgi:N-6 DNA Methylase/Helicase conserved C-terminal domain
MQQTPEGAVAPASVSTPLNTLARLKLNAELAGLLKEKAGLPAGPLSALKGAKLASQILVVLGKLGVDLEGKKRENEAFALEGGPEPVPEPRKSTAHLYDFDPNRKTSQRRKDNGAAMELLRQIDKGEISADALTDAQKEALARYSGTGGNLVGADGLLGSDYEYYTPKPIAEGIWGLLGELGFKGGKTLDPCAGVGVFGATSPDNVAMETIELDPTSGRINQLVNGGPSYSATISPFEAVASKTADEQFDAVVSNIPFSKEKSARGTNYELDPKYQNETIEAYFILRSLEKLKPGGLAAFIVPPRMVSAKGGRDEKLRIALSYMAEFMGAYRLPNSVFGTASADTITDVIVLRKYGRDALEKIAELKQQNPAMLATANVQWMEFISGNYFRGEGLRFVLGEFIAKDPNKVRDVDRVVTNGSVADIAKLLRKFPGSRVDWALLNATETEPILYNEGDTITMAGQTLQMQGGKWVPLAKTGTDVQMDDLGNTLSTPVRAVSEKAAWDQAAKYVAHRRQLSKELDVPDWLRIAESDVQKAPEADRPSLWNALATGMAVAEVTKHHGQEVGFNYSENYPAIHGAMQMVAATAKRGFSRFTPASKHALQTIGLNYDRKKGFDPFWMGQVSTDVTQGKELTKDAKVEGLKYRAQGLSVSVEDLKEVYGADFDPIESDDWCVSADGKKASKPDDYYIGNMGDFLARMDAEIAQAEGPLKDKLLRQKALARERVDVVDPKTLRYNLFSPFVSIEEKAAFLRQFMHPAFDVGYDSEGEKKIILDITTDSENDRQLKRFAEYLQRGTISTRTKGVDALADPKLEDQRRNMIREMVMRANAQFDQWTKANSDIMGRIESAANDPAKVYFRETEDGVPFVIDGMNTVHPATGEPFSLHAYQFAEVKRRSRYFGGITGLDVGLGKTLCALACAQHIQNIGVKKKTIFVVPNAVLSNWRREASVAYQSIEDCLFIGLDLDAKTGKAKVSSSNYARDFHKVLQNRHRKIFCTMEAFKTIPLRDETVYRYEDYLASVDPSFSGSDRKSETVKAENALSKVTDTGAKSGALPFFEDMGIDSIVLDEVHCFPAGTMVDGVPIEALKIGDKVRSYNHETGVIELRDVTDVMSREAPAMVRVHLANGQSIVCTHNHPFYTESEGYLAAEFLSESDVVYINHSKAPKHEPVQLHALPTAVPSIGHTAQQDQDRPSAEAVLRTGMLRQGGNQEDANQPALRGVFDGVRTESHAELEVREGARDSVLLHQNVCISEQAQDIRKDEGVGCQRCEEAGCTRGPEKEWELASNTRGGGEESAQADCQRSAQGAGVCAAGRQWAASVGSAPVDGGCPGVAGGVRCPNEDAQGQWVSNGVQAGSGAPCAEDRAGDRWEFASGPQSAGAGCQEDGALIPVGVVRVEVLERAGDDEFGGLCPGGLVYDITVDGNHNFFAEGILVHNCYKNSKRTVEFTGAKFLSSPKESDRGLDMQIKAWFVRGLSPQKDGVLGLTATPITNSPLEVYSMLSLTAGEDRVHNMTMGARGSDQFMDLMCAISDEDEETIDGLTKSYRVFSGLQNVKVLRSAMASVVTIKTGEDVKDQGVDLKLPEAPENQTLVQLPRETLSTLRLYQLGFRAAIMRENDQEALPEEQAMYDAAYDAVAAKFGEPQGLMANAFNLIGKMTSLILDPELDERATFYTIAQGDIAKAEEVIAKFNAKPRKEERDRPGPWTGEGMVSAPRIKKKNGQEEMVFDITVKAALTEDDRIVIDTMDFKTQEAFEVIAEKAGLNLEVSIPPKLAALLDNVQKEEANPRSKSGRVKQIIFCDNLSMHNKIKRLLSQRAGIPASAIAFINGPAIKNPEQMQGIQDGFNGEGEDNKYRLVIANKKAEVGINLQKGTQAIHHLTIGWTPDSQHQRNGRGVRQGNDTTVVNIYHYDADGTFDEYKRLLTNRKADWIGSVMDGQGGNDVAIAGGLTKEEERELAMAEGTAEIALIQQRAQARDKMTRTKNARDRQAINVGTYKSQAEFLKAYKDPVQWAARAIMAAYDAQETMQKLEASLEPSENGKQKKAETILKIQSAIANLKVNLEGMIKRVDECVTFTGRYKSTAEILASSSYYEKKPTQRRESVQYRAESAIKVNEGSDIEREWQAEILRAERIQEEALKDFEAIGNGGDSGYPAQFTQAIKDGNALVLDGKIYAKGMFVRAVDNFGAKYLLVVKDNQWCGSPKTDVGPARISTVASKGWEVIIPGTAEYEEALNEAAQIDDSMADGLPQYLVSELFTAYVPEVAQRRTKKTTVGVLPGRLRLDAPMFPHAIRPKDGCSEALKAIAAKQASVILEWRDNFATAVVSSDGAYTILEHRDQVESNVFVADLAEVAKAYGAPLTIEDYQWAHGAFRLQTDGGRLVSDLLTRLPLADQSQAIAEAASEDAVIAIVKQAVDEALSGALIIPEGFDYMGALSYGNIPMSGQAGFRIRTIAKEAQATLAAEEARLAAERGEVTATATEAPAIASASSIRLTPWTSSKTGEQRVYFNGLPGLQQKKEGFYAHASSTASRGWAFGASKEVTYTRQEQFAKMVEAELLILNGGQPVESFQRINELAGVVVAPVMPDTVPVAEGELSGTVAIRGKTLANKDLIKQASAVVGGAPKWNKNGGDGYWAIPAAGWAWIKTNHPEVASQLSATQA